MTAPATPLPPPPVATPPMPTVPAEPVRPPAFAPLSLLCPPPGDSPVEDSLRPPQAAPTTSSSASIPPERQVFMSLHYTVMGARLSCCFEHAPPNGFHAYLKPSYPRGGS